MAPILEAPLDIPTGQIPTPAQEMVDQILTSGQEGRLESNPNLREGKLNFSTSVEEGRSESDPVLGGRSDCDHSPGEGRSDS